jgi:non-ribosomal peptide synthetase component E (peptide arylation enzyme)
LDQLCAHLLEHELARVKLPEELVLIDSLPTNAGGKVDKNALRDHVAKELAGRRG